MYLPIETESQRIGWQTWNVALEARCLHELKCVACLTGQACQSGLLLARAEQAAAHTAYRAACDPREEVAV